MNDIHTQIIDLKYHFAVNNLWISYAFYDLYHLMIKISKNSR